ncbi:MAG TPA: hypothetical protein VGI47_10785 [Candidatus Binataceae bacterium]
MFHPKEDAAHEDVEGEVPFLGRGIRDSTERTPETGVVEYTIEPSERFFRGRDGSANIFFVAHVGALEDDMGREFPRERGAEFHPANRRSRRARRF